VVRKVHKKGMLRLQNEALCAARLSFSRSKNLRQEEKGCELEVRALGNTPSWKKKTFYRRPTSADGVAPSSWKWPG